MPKLKKPDTISQKKADICNAIKAAGALRNKSKPEMADIGGMSLTAYYYKLRGRNEFTLTEILRYSQKLGIKFEFRMEAGV